LSVAAPLLARNSLICHSIANNHLQQTKTLSPQPTFQDALSLDR